MGNTTSNLIEVREVSLGIEQFIVAPFPTVWTPGVIDISSPPAGFVALGAVDEESASIVVNRSQFQLRVGIPQALQFQATTSLESRISFSLHARSSRKIQYALSNATPINMPPATLVVVSTPAATATTITLAASPANNWVLGDEIVTSVTTDGATDGFDVSQNVAVITSINGLEVHFENKGFSPIPTEDEFVAKPLGTRVPFGMKTTRQFRLIGIADFVDGYQLVHDFEKVQSIPEFTEEIKSSQNARINLQFEAFGLENATWANELIVGERFIFPLQ